MGLFRILISCKVGLNWPINVENSTLCPRIVHQYDQYDADDDSVGKLSPLAVEVECFYIIVARNPRLTVHKKAKNFMKSPYSWKLKKPFFCEIWVKSWSKS